MRKQLRRWSLSLGILVLSGCNSLSSTAVDMMREALDGPAQVTVERVNQLNSKALIGSYGAGEALFPLAAQYGATALWQGSRESLATQNGRLIQTAGMPIDILSPLGDNDPFRSDLRSLRDGQEVMRQVDFPSLFQTGLPQRATYFQGPRETLEIMGTSRKLQRIDEHIEMPTLDFSAVNYYWIDPASGDVIASVQHLRPGEPALRLTQVTPSGVQQ